MQLSQDDGSRMLDASDLSSYAHLLEDRYHALAMVTGQIIWTADAHGHLTGDVHPWCAFTGQGPDEAQEGGWSAVTHPEDREGIQRTWHEALMQQTPYEHEARIRRYDGEFRCMLIRAAPVFAGNNRVREWIGTCTDITELRRAEQNTARQAREVETILDTLAEGVAVYDADGAMVRINPAARRIIAGEAPLPLDTQERVRRYQMRDPLTNRLLTADEWPLTRILRGEVLSGDDAVDIALRGLDGQERILAVSGSPLRGADGTIQGAVVITHDIAQRRWLSLRMRQALSALLDLAQTLVLGVPGAGDAANLAESARQMVGCARAAITTYNAATGRQQPLAIAGVSPEEAAAWHASLTDTRLADFLEARHIAALSAGNSIVLDATPPPQQEHPFGNGMALLCPMRSGHNLVGILSLDFGPVPHTYTPEEIEIAGGIAGLLTLVLERERLLAEREAAQTQMLVAEQAKKQMDDFLSIASHELRTPLTSLLANLQIAARQLADLRPLLSDLPLSRVRPRLERLDVIVSRAEGQSQRIRRLVDDLLDVSRIESGKLRLTMSPCDLLEIVRESVVEQHVTWPERRIVLDLPRRNTLLITGDADRIGQVVTNYLTNALKYAPEEQPVTVKVRARTGFARVEVCDQGPGIAPEEQQHLFERFYRVPGIKVQQRAEVGLGLGLFICRTIIERHGGRVGVISAPGEGTRFWFTVPLASGREAGT